MELDRMVEIEREKERVFGQCGGACGEAPCVNWNNQRRSRERINEEDARAAKEPKG